MASMPRRRQPPPHQQTPSPEMTLSGLAATCQTPVPRPYHQATNALHQPFPRPISFCPPNSSLSTPRHVVVMTLPPMCSVWVIISDPNLSTCHRIFPICPPDRLRQKRWSVHHTAHALVLLKLRFQFNQVWVRHSQFVLLIPNLLNTAVNDLRFPSGGALLTYWVGYNGTMGYNGLWG
jgi:hypothetical protein